MKTSQDNNPMWATVQYLQVCAIILVDNSQENTDENVHANDGEDDEEKGIPIASIVRWNPTMWKR